MLDLLRFNTARFSLLSANDHLLQSIRSSIAISPSS